MGTPIVEKAFIQLIQQHSGIIHKVCNLYVEGKENREDLFQEITLQAWKSYPRFQGNAQFSTWLYRVALNTAITYFKQQKRNPIHHSADQVPELPDADADNREEKFQLMYQAIAQLTDVDKALVLLYLEDFPYDEIATMMGITANHVAVKINRIKSKLQLLTRQMM